MKKGTFDDFSNELKVLTNQITSKYEENSKRNNTIVIVLAVAVVTVLIAVIIFRDLKRRANDLYEDDFDYDDFDDSYYDDIDFEDENGLAYTDDNDFVKE